MSDFSIERHKDGVHNVETDENIPDTAAQDELNWLTVNGGIELSRGKVTLGPEGVGGDCGSVWPGYKVNGQKVLWRKAGTKIQYFNTATNLWVDVITGLVATDDYIFQNYSSLSGAFTFAFGPGGIFKMNNANPGSYLAMYDSTKNFKGRGLIDKGRTLMYNTEKDKTGLYGSWVDAQNSTVYTTVTNEVLATGDGIQTTFSGVLAFKGSNPLANLFGLQINMNPAGITAVDDYNGVISGAGVSGTINYITGAYSLTFTSPVAAATQIRATYQWENSNVKGITDFSKSTPRQAGEGFVLRQDEGGDEIMRVVIGIDGNYYSVKKNSCDRYIADKEDKNPDNGVFRKDIGVPYWQAVVSTSIGIVLINTAQPDRPQLTILEKNPIGDDLQVRPLMTQFKFENYDFSEAVLETWGAYVVLSCKTIGNITNNRLFLCDILRKTIDISYYGMKSLTKDSGYLYGGSPLTQSVYKLFDGKDDDGSLIENYWIGKGQRYKVNRLKKFRREWLRGFIELGQSYEVYAAYDDGDFSLVGTVLSDAGYVDTSSPATIGTAMVGEEAVGGDVGQQVTIYPYFVELKMKTPKFRKRTLKFVAKGYGYVSIIGQTDHDILVFEERIPKKYRQKQNVSLDGQTTDMANPEF